MVSALYEAALNRLVVLLNSLTRGGLAIALCEDIKLRATLMEELRPRLTRPLHELTLSAENNDPVTLLQDCGAQTGDIAIFHDVEAGGDDAIKRLEFRREAVWALGVNLLFWVTGEGQRRFLADAPNFYSRRVLLAQFTAPAPPVVTFLCADVVEFASLTTPEQQKSLRALRQLLTQQIQQSGGQVVNQAGDSFTLTFTDPAAAVACAVALQKQMLTGAIETPSGSLQTRIGIHTGSAPRVQGEVVGPDVARVMSLSALASGGQILLSSETYARVRDQIGDLTLYPHGTVALRGASGLQEVYEVLWPGHYPRPLRGTHIPTNLPPPLASFIGRAAALERIGAALEEGKPLVLIGEPGFGKTSLALEAAHSAYKARRFAGGVAWVNLTDNISLDSIIVTIAYALALVRERAPLPADLRAALDGHVRRVPCLLVLDGAEAAAANVELWQWVQSLPVPASFLITTREPLPALKAQQIERVEALPAGEAAALFLARARERLTADQLQSWNDEPQETLVARIVDRCAGIPLAVELAAGLVDKLSLQEIADGLVADRDMTPQGVLLHALEQTYQKLEAVSQVALAQLSIFPDSFSSEAAAAVCEITNAQEVLDRLQEAALIQRMEAAGRSRYTMHPITRAYTGTKLSSLALYHPAAHRFVTYYCQLVEDNADINDLSNLAVLAAEWRNAIAAAETAEKLGDFKAILTFSKHLAEFLRLRGLWSEGESLNKRALKAAGALSDQHAKGKALNDLGVFYRYQGRWTEAEQALGQALATQRQINDRLGARKSLNNLGSLYLDREQLDKAKESYEQALKLSLQLHDRRGQAIVLRNLGNLYQIQGQGAESEVVLKQALEIFRQLGDYSYEGRTLRSLGVTHKMQEHWAAAETALQKSLEIAKELGAGVGEGKALENLALLRESQGDIESALDFGRRAVAVLERTEGTKDLERVRQWVAEWEQALNEQQ